MQNLTIENARQARGAMKDRPCVARSTQCPALRSANRRMRRADKGLRCLSPQGEFAKHPARRIRRAGIAAGDATAGRASLLTFLRAQESKSPAGARPGRRMSLESTSFPDPAGARGRPDRRRASAPHARQHGMHAEGRNRALSADQPMNPGFRFAASGLRVNPNRVMRPPPSIAPTAGCVGRIRGFAV